MKFAFIFPGQGSQKIGMLSKLAMQYPIIKDTFHKVSNLLGYDLWILIQHGPIEELNKTWITQPALLTASVVLWHIWCQLGGKRPYIMAGHSLGEYSALVCAEVISFEDAIRLVEIRGKLMQETVPEGIGAMSVIIGLKAHSILDICKKHAKNQIVSPVNFNSLDQIVISGHKEAVKRVEIACKIAGAKLILPLSISVPSHCILMKSAAEKLAMELENFDFKTPKIPVLNNVDIKCEVSPIAIRDALVRQLYNPVQWVKTISFIYNKGIKNFYEVGPGKVLTNLTRQINKKLNVKSIDNSDTMLSIIKQS